jgi:DNA (cytosine-5)-methyltransferase 1
VKFASFFSGIGGFELGLTRAGHECVWACEIDPFARAVYQARFGRAPAEDVTRVSPEEIPEADLWCGGFPCQDLSTAGKRAGLGAGTRSGLVWIPGASDSKRYKAIGNAVAVVVLEWIGRRLADA